MSKTTQVRLINRIAMRVKQEAAQNARSIPKEVNRALFLYYFAADTAKKKL